MYSYQAEQATSGQVLHRYEVIPETKGTVFLSITKFVFEKKKTGYISTYASYFLT